MSADPRHVGGDLWRILGPARIVAVGLALAAPGAAFAYIGDSFISVPGQHGHWKGKQYRGWIRAEANQWSGRLRMLNSGATDPLAGDKLFFGGPNAPRPGNKGKLVLALDKRDPDTRVLMGLCTGKAMLPEMTYAESSDRARPILELGPRPADLPAFWEYKLKEVTVVSCPVAEGADQQAFVLAFKDIDWLNYGADRPLANKVVVKPEDLLRVTPAESVAGKKIKSFVITWISQATTTTDEQCPVMSAKPTETDVFRYLSKEEIAAIKAKNGEKGLSAGLDTENRGPGKLNAVLLPGIVPDPGLPEPRTDVAEGIDLDGNDGRGGSPVGIRKHVNFRSPDGRTGIDNQIFRVMGCVPGARGKRGYRNQTSNARRADGNISTLVEISGIDDDRNDADVDVALIYSMDKPVRDTSGHIFIPNYTFRPSANPNFALYNVRVHGRIVNGVVTTDVLPLFKANLGQDPELVLHDMRMRFEPQPDGSMKGYIGGYLDWRVAADANGSGYSEGLFGFQAPALYYALKRYADGMKDPVTGEYNGISVAYEVDAVPAFLTPAAPAPTATASALPSSSGTR